MFYKKRDIVQNDSGQIPSSSDQPILTDQIIIEVDFKTNESEMDESELESWFGTSIIDKRVTLEMTSCRRLMLIAEDYVEDLNIMLDVISVKSSIGSMEYHEERIDQQQRFKLFADMETGGMQK